VKLLLDTHVWIWSLVEPERLPRRVVRALTEEENELWLSPITPWEVLILAEKGRLDLDTEPAAWLETALQVAPLHEAPITHEIAIASRQIGLSHGDPADRFLAATAKVLNLTLVTADERLLNCKDIRTMLARSGRKTLH
jgi:PIN domain nuclease of toxin-antitoxin system